MSNPEDQNQDTGEQAQAPIQPLSWDGIGKQAHRDVVTMSTHLPVDRNSQETLVTIHRYESPGGPVVLTTELRRDV